MPAEARARMFDSALARASRAITEHNTRGTPLPEIYDPRERPAEAPSGGNDTDPLGLRR
jgi:hypothetical protein